MEEAVYGIILTGKKHEVKMMENVMNELKDFAFIDEEMGPNDFIQDCFQIGYNEYLKQLAMYYDTCENV